LAFQRTLHFIDEWSFLGGFWTHLGLLSPRRFNEWIPLVILTLCSHCTWSHSTLNWMCPWCNLFLSHDLIFKWNLFHYSGETLYWLTSHTLCFQFHNVFATHFSPHQFGIVTKGGCEAIIHGIRCSLNFHLD